VTRPASPVAPKQWWIEAETWNQHTKQTKAEPPQPEVTVGVAAAARVHVVCVCAGVCYAVIVKALCAGEAGDGVDCVAQFVGSAGTVAASVARVGERLTAVRAHVTTATGTLFFNT